MDFFIVFFGQFAREPVQKKPILWSDRPEGLPPPQLMVRVSWIFSKGIFFQFWNLYAMFRREKITKLPMFVCLDVLIKRKR